jgi:hypothetical protein
MSDRRHLAIIAVDEAARKADGGTTPYADYGFEAARTAAADGARCQRVGPPLLQAVPPDNHASKPALICSPCAERLETLRTSPTAP